MIRPYFFFYVEVNVRAGDKKEEVVCMVTTDYTLSILGVRGLMYTRIGNGDVKTLVGAIILLSNFSSFISLNIQFTDIAFIYCSNSPPVMLFASSIAA